MEATWTKWGHLGWSLQDERGDVLATLQRIRPDGTLTRCEIAGRSWTFKRVGFSQLRVSMREEGAEDDPIVFQTTLPGEGTAPFEGGRVSGWISKPSIGEWTWSRPGGARVLTIRPHPLTSRGLVSFETAKPHLEQLRLSALGWYLVLMGAADGGASMLSAISAATFATA